MAQTRGRYFSGERARKEGFLKRVLLFQIDGKMPNIALMRIAAHHRALGDEITFRKGHTRFLGDAMSEPDLVYGSAIFERSRPMAERLKKDFPQAIVGGTGVDVGLSLEQIGIQTREQDYSIFPGFAQSIGFTQRGCRLRCGFCVVPRKEGAVSEDRSPAEIWRGDPWPRELVLLDNDFFGQPNWPKRVEEIRAGGFRVNFNQGINARFLTDESAAALATLDFRNASMTTKRIYSAWDNAKDEARLFQGLGYLVKHGINPDNVMIYVLVGFWPGETEADRLYRIQKLIDFGVRPYPMPFVRTRELVGLQRWCNGAYYKKISWPKWKAAKYQPSNLRLNDPNRSLNFERNDDDDFEAPQNAV
jgi:hypothetical protein